MIYRLRIYQAVAENIDAFHAFFREHLMPIQLRHGARLVGRWASDDARIFALFEYDDMAAYERIDGAVCADPDSAVAREVRETIEPLFTSFEDVFMHSTL